MHELGIAQETLDIALAEAQRQGAARVLSMRLRIGDLSGVVPEALEFALETIMEGTPADGARIVIDHIAPQCTCATCGLQYEIHMSSDTALEGHASACPGTRGSASLQVGDTTLMSPITVSCSYACPRCGAVNTDLLCGKEMDLMSLEVA